MTQPPFASYYFFYAEKFVNTQERFEGFFEPTEVAGFFCSLWQQKFCKSGWLTLSAEQNSFNDFRLKHWNIKNRGNVMSTFRACQVTAATVKLQQQHSQTFTIFEGNT